MRSVEYLTEARDTSINLDEYQGFDEELREARVVLNATPKGFKLLQKRLRQAERAGDFQGVLSTTMDLQTAAQHRIAFDGTAKWEGVSRDPDLFHEKVLTEGKAHSKVEVPIHLTGSSNIGQLLHRIQNTPGHRIVDVELAGEEHMESKQKARIKKEILDYVEEYSNSSWYAEVLEPNDVTARGLTYEDDHKNVIQVTGSWTVR